MTQQHFSAVIYIGDYLVTGQLSDYQYELTELSDDKMVLHRNTSNQTNQILDREEAELQAVDAELDMNQPLDDIPEDGEEAASAATSNITTEQRIEAMNKKQEIQNNYQSEVDQVLANAQVVEEDIDKKITMKETQIQALEAEKQTYDDYLDQTDMGYFGN